MATDFISREAASDLLAMALIDEWEPEYAQDRLREVPAADVRPVVHAEWVEDDYGFIHCSVCGMEWDEPEHPKTSFCPNCGADMGEVKADDR